MHVRRVLNSMCIERESASSERRRLPGTLRRGRDTEGETPREEERERRGRAGGTSDRGRTREKVNVRKEVHKKWRVATGSQIWRWRLRRDLAKGYIIREGVCLGIEVPHSRRKEMTGREGSRSGIDFKGM